jgi:sulfite oxidase
LSWEGAAIGNAKWTGVLLKDVLEYSGVLGPSELTNSKSLHVQAEAYDVGADGKPFGTSVPLEMAIKNGAILAFYMNGEKLSRDHGYPVRLIVPGVVGVRNVKWVDRIILSEEESDSHWQTHDYKGN